jgi:c-di-GMP-binding flagellar brake protein YcgR
MKMNRKQQRFSISNKFPTKAQIKVGTEVYQAELIDISRGGTLVRAEGNLPFGASVTLSFSLPDLASPCNVPCIVRWVNKETEVGLQFVRLRAIEMWGLNQFLRLLSPLDA